MSRLNYFQTRPKLPAIDLVSYLDRIGLQREPANLAFLKKIHKAHLHNIPFENLDIHYRNKIVLNVESIFKKVILNRRGGFCYELNLLVLHLLNQLGYQTYLASARVFQKDHLSPEFDHMIVIVKWEDDQYLVDVGFGELFTEPKKITDQPQLDYNQYFKFETDPDGHFLLKRSRDHSSYETVYQFDPQPREVIEFLPRCVWHQESADSHFTQGKLITQLFPEGRITLTDRTLKINWKGELSEFPILNEDAFLSKLEEHFGISASRLIGQQLG